MQGIIHTAAPGEDHLGKGVTFLSSNHHPRPEQSMPGIMQTFKHCYVKSIHTSRDGLAYLKIIKSVLARH